VLSRPIAHGLQLTAVVNLLCTLHHAGVVLVSAYTSDMGDLLETARGYSKQAWTSSWHLPVFNLCLLQFDCCRALLL
jgi:hypothetical protein